MESNCQILYIQVRLFKKRSAYEEHKQLPTMINPDIFFALDASPANDMSGDKNEFGQLGKGAFFEFLTSQW